MLVVVVVVAVAVAGPANRQPKCTRNKNNFPLQSGGSALVPLVGCYVNALECLIYIKTTTVAIHHRRAASGGQKGRSASEGQ